MLERANVGYDYYALGFQAFIRYHGRLFNVQVRHASITAFLVLRMSFGAVNRAVARGRE